MAIDEAYLVEQLKALLAIDSPTGYTDQVVRHCSKELVRLGLTPERFLDFVFPRSGHRAATLALNRP